MLLAPARVHDGHDLLCVGSVVSYADADDGTVGTPERIATAAEWSPQRALNDLPLYISAVRILAHYEQCNTRLICGVSALVMM